MKNIVRSFDIAGAEVGLKYAGEGRFKTMGGGLLTSCLRVVTLTYFIMRVITLAEFEDASISSFEVIEDRSDMNSALALEKHNMDFFFGFTNVDSSQPVPLDPRIGSFTLDQAQFSATDGSFKQENFQIPIESVDLDSSPEVHRLFHLFDTKVKGLLRPSKSSQLSVKGSIDDYESSTIELVFQACR